MKALIFRMVIVFFDDCKIVLLIFTKSQLLVNLMKNHVKRGSFMKLSYKKSEAIMTPLYGLILSKRRYPSQRLRSKHRIDHAVFDVCSYSYELVKLHL